MRWATVKQLQLCPSNAAQLWRKVAHLAVTVCKRTGNDGNGLSNLRLDFHGLEAIAEVCGASTGWNVLVTPEPAIFLCRVLP